MPSLRPVQIAELAWNTLSETQRDQISAETVERIADYPELAPLVRHQLAHAARRLRDLRPTPFRLVETTRHRIAPRAARLAR